MRITSARAMAVEGLGCDAPDETEMAPTSEGAMDAPAVGARAAVFAVMGEVCAATQGRVDGARPSLGLPGPRGHGEAAGRIPRAERNLATPGALVFVDRQGNEVPTPEGREARADGYYPYVRDGYVQLTREAAAAFRALRQEALSRGYNLRLNDGFRPDAEQLRRRAEADTNGTADADARVAPPGTSEHRTGRAFDIGTAPTMPDGTPARRGLGWVIANAALFGINHYDGPAGERMHFSYNVR